MCKTYLDTEVREFERGRDSPYILTILRFVMFRKVRCQCVCLGGGGGGAVGRGGVGDSVGCVGIGVGVNIVMVAVWTDVIAGVVPFSYYFLGCSIYICTYDRARWVVYSRFLYELDLSRSVFF